MESAVEGVVLGGDDVGRADAVPVKRRVEDGLEEVAVGQVVGPLALALEAAGDGVVADGLFAKAQLRQRGLPIIRSRAISAILTGLGPVLVLLCAAVLLSWAL